VVGTCNGLVCLSDNLNTYIDKLFLWNPCVRKFVKIPSPNVEVTFWTHCGFNASIGFGFDAKANDYKVVRMVYLEIYADDRKDRPEVEVYSLSTGEWRVISPLLPPICVLNSDDTPAFVNGAMHWIAFRRNDDFELHHFVLVFDLGDEVFREILLPEFPDYNPEGEGRSELCAGYGNSIALFQGSYCNSGFLKIWVMKEYGVASSWTVVLAIHNQDLGSRGFIPRPVGFRRNGKVVLAFKKGKLVSWDLEGKELKSLRITSCMSPFVDSYVESLVLLDKATNGAVTY
jgi:F-box interacting protein